MTHSRSEGSSLKHFFHFFISCLLTLLLAFGLVVVNASQCLSCIFYPFSKPFFFHLNRHIAKTWWFFCVLYFRRFKKLKIIYSGDLTLPDQNLLLLPNHQAMADIILLLEVGYQHKQLAKLNWFAKDSIKYIPGFGWGLFFTHGIFLKRQWEKDQRSIYKTFSSILADKSPLWLTTFLEGTRWTPEKLKKSQTFSQQNQLPLLKHVLLPRTKGCLATLQGLKGHLEGILDITLGYQTEPPSLLWFFLKPNPKPIRIHLRYFPISQVPSSSEEQKQWVIQLFKEKDQILEAWRTP